MFRLLRTYEPATSSGTLRNVVLTALLGTVVLTGCDDKLGPRFDLTPVRTVRVWSIDRMDIIEYPSAFDFANEKRVIVHAVGSTGHWDVTATDWDGGLAFAPAGAYPDLASDAGIAVMDVGFDDVEEAPRGDDAYVRDQPVPVDEGDVLVVRTRRAPCGFGSAFYYAKVRITEVDPVAGSITFEYVLNPNCNDRSLVRKDD